MVDTGLFTHKYTASAMKRVGQVGATCLCSGGSCKYGEENTNETRVSDHTARSGCESMVLSMKPTHISYA